VAFDFDFISHGKGLAFSGIVAPDRLRKKGFPPPVGAIAKIAAAGCGKSLRNLLPLSYLPWSRLSIYSKSRAFGQ
jgi:hypothetical protein